MSDYHQWHVAWWYQAITWTSTDLLLLMFYNIHMSKFPIYLSVSWVWKLYLKNYGHISQGQWVKQLFEAQWYIYVSIDWTIISSDNALSPIWHQAIIWTNDDVYSIKPYGTHFNEILFKIQKFSFKEMHLKISSVKQWPFRFSLIVLKFISSLLTLILSWWQQRTMPAVVRGNLCYMGHIQS